MEPKTPTEPPAVAAEVDEAFVPTHLFTLSDGRRLPMLVVRYKHLSRSVAFSRDTFVNHHRPESDAAIEFRGVEDAYCEDSSGGSWQSTNQDVTIELVEELSATNQDGAHPQGASPAQGVFNVRLEGFTPALRGTLSVGAARLGGGFQVAVRLRSSMPVDRPVLVGMLLRALGLREDGAEPSASDSSTPPWRSLDALVSAPGLGEFAFRPEGRPVDADAPRVLRDPLAPDAPAVERNVPAAWKTIDAERIEAVGANGLTFPAWFWVLPDESEIHARVRRDGFDPHFLRRVEYDDGTRLILYDVQGDDPTSPVHLRLRCYRAGEDVVIASDLGDAMAILRARDGDPTTHTIDRWHRVEDRAVIAIPRDPAPDPRQCPCQHYDDDTAAATWRASSPAHHPRCLRAHPRKAAATWARERGRGLLCRLDRGATLTPPRSP